MSANEARTTNHTAPSPSRARPLSVVLGITRIALGWTFLWAFLDKTFGLGHETASADAWINGGSPTSGFLGNATAGPFADFYKGMAGQAWADWLFMVGLLGIGTALVLGVAMRLATGAGIVLLMLMWSAVLPPANNPFLDDHIIYSLVLGVLAMSSAGSMLGFGGAWEKLPIVGKYPVLR